jgi:hypothetical protein
MDLVFSAVAIAVTATAAVDCRRKYENKFMYGRIK